MSNKILNIPYEPLSIMGITYDFEEWANTKKEYSDSNYSFFDKQGAARLCKYFDGLMTNIGARYEGYTITAQVKEKAYTWQDLLNICNKPDYKLFLYDLTYFPVVPIYYDFAVDKQLEEPKIDGGYWVIRYAGK